MRATKVFALVLLSLALLVASCDARKGSKGRPPRRSSEEAATFKSHARERLDRMEEGGGGVKKKSPGVKCVAHYDLVVYGDQFRLDLYVNDRRDRHEGYVLEMDLPFLWEIESVEGDNEVELAINRRNIILSEHERIVSPGYPIDDLQIYGSFERSPRFISQPSSFRLDDAICKSEGDMMVVESPLDFAKGVRGIGFFRALWWVMSTTFRVAFVAAVVVGLYVLVKTKRWLVNRDPGGVGARKRAESDCDTHAASFSKTLEGVHDAMVMLSPRSAPSNAGMRHIAPTGGMKPMRLVA